MRAGHTRVRGAAAVGCALLLLLRPPLHWVVAALALLQGSVLGPPGVASMGLPRGTEPTLWPAQPTTPQPLQPQPLQQPLPQPPTQPSSASPEQQTRHPKPLQQRYLQHPPAPAPSAPPEPQTLQLQSRHLQLQQQQQQRLQRREVDDPQSLKERSSRHCDRFTDGDPDAFRFYSPLYSANYPNSTDCYRILDAGKGNIVSLDFRDAFHMEADTNCEYDYLEIRDGGHGYDELLGKYCGSEFPPNITSRGRYLWLHFHSDENIEYGGFVAVYAFRPRPAGGVVEPMEEECSMQRNGSEGIIRETDIDPEVKELARRHGTPLDCMWVIRVADGWRVQLSFPAFALDKPNACEANFLDVFKAHTELPSRLRLFCGAAAETVESDTNVMHLRFFAAADALASRFEAVYTAFRDSSSGCTEDEFDCQDNTCISRDLLCNTRTNCRQLWDEDPGECAAGKKTAWDIIGADHIIIILVIFCLILSGMCFAFLYNCIRKLLRDHKIIKEHIRQSRENRLDEVGKAPSMTLSTRGAGGGGRGRSSSGGPVALEAVAGGGGNGGDGSGGGSAGVDELRDSSSPRRAAPDDCYVPGDGDLLPILLGAGRGAAPAPAPVPPSASAPANGDVVFVRDSNAGQHHLHHHYGDDDMDDLDFSMAAFPPPEMRDNECQTRESLFLNSSSEHSATPPPPPPPPLAPHYAGHTHHSGSSGFSTFGYGGRGPKECSTLPHAHHHHHHHHHHASPPAQPLPPRAAPAPAPVPAPGPTPAQKKQFRAEAVIEVEQRAAAGKQAPPPPPQRPFSVQSTKSAPDVIVTH